MIKSIQSSKLYIASSRKDRINAAMIAPSNLGLVQQLAEDLDEQYQPSATKQEPAEPKQESTEGYDKLFDDEEINPETDLMTVNDLGGQEKSAPSHRLAPSKSAPASDNDAKSKEPADTSELIPDSPMTEEPEKEQKPVEESTQIVSTTIIKPEEKVNLDVLKGSLNGRSDTNGVTRVAEKESEIWVYYNDDINLNNIMTDVIEYVANAGFTALEFNRLARSDNAIVFDLLNQTVSRPDKQMEEAAE